MATTTTGPRRWNEILRPYIRPSYRKSAFQLLNSAVPFALLWFLMLRASERYYWITLLLAVPATGFLIRLFIIQHDCGHGSFFRSKMLNDRLGAVLGLLTLTPYSYWRKTHAMHHATSGDLDHRELGDVTILTVKEYLGLSRWGRLIYRLYRNPLVLFGVGPIYQFIFKHRLPLDMPRSWKKEWASVAWNNLAIVAVTAVMWKTIGIVSFLKVQLPITLLGGIGGVWLFYIQHQFEDTYWENEESWDFHDAGLRGSSYYDLPRILHWFTGNIGVHHVHHLSSRIPNYRLRQCLRENPELQRVTRLTVWSSLKSLRLKLWDEDQRKLVGFRHLTTLRARA